MTCYVRIKEVITLLGCKGYVSWSQDHGSYTSLGNPGMMLKSELSYSAFQRLKIKLKSIFQPDRKVKDKFCAYLLKSLL